jgi:hypothetical protein
MTWKTAAKKKTAGKMKAKKSATRKTTARRMVATEVAAKIQTAKTYRREDIANITLQYPDESDWRLAAKALRIRPFYNGRDSRPWRCFTATIMAQPGRGPVNDFAVLPECRVPGYIPD